MVNINNHSGFIIEFIYQKEFFSVILFVIIKNSRIYFYCTILVFHFTINFKAYSNKTLLLFTKKVI